MTLAQFVNYLVACMFAATHGHAPVVEDHPWPTTPAYEAEAPASIPGPTIIETTDIPAATADRPYDPATDNCHYSKEDPCS